MSRTTLDLDDEALAGAMQLAPDKTKTEVINQALREYASRRAFQELLELEGKVTWDGDLDALRKRDTAA